jgi:hypothetical protein
MRPHFSPFAIAVLVAGCGASYSAKEVNLVSLGFREHDVVVRFQVPSGNVPLGVRTSKHGDGVAMEFARSGHVDCAAKRYGDDQFKVTVPCDVRNDRVVYLRDGDEFVQLAGASAR